MTIWYILWEFAILFPVLVCFTKKNLATLFPTFLQRRKINFLAAEEENVLIGSDWKAVKLFFFRKQSSIKCYLKMGRGHGGRVRQGAARTCFYKP
jgi:hypothetical protein